MHNEGGRGQRVVITQKCAHKYYPGYILRMYMPILPYAYTVILTSPDRAFNPYTALSFDPTRKDPLMTKSSFISMSAVKGSC